MKAKRRFTEHKEGNRYVVLPQSHAAAVSGRTIYQARVEPSSTQSRLLKSGAHSRKIGSHVIKGAWRGMPIFTLTLEERATCPRACAHWHDCYGNKMNWSVRIAADADLTAHLNGEVQALSRRYPRGFVIRLHVLGDFFSVEYVAWWLSMLGRYPMLRIFGYTAWPVDSAIGDAIARGHGLYWHRFRIRFSGGPHNRLCATTVESPDQAGDAIVCPAQTGRAECCGTCSLCWETDQPIAFLRH